jgi:hypothetical protein
LYQVVDSVSELSHHDRCPTPPVLPDDERIAEEMVEYTKVLLEEVLEDGVCKPSGTVLALQPQSAGSVADALEAVEGADITESLGTWVRRALCLVPVQISRCAGNTLEPMHDGEPRRDAAAPEDIVDLSKNLRLGPFECILNAHKGPVKARTRLAAALCQSVETFAGMQMSARSQLPRADPQVAPPQQCA